jgi:hypothetical protein
MAWIHTWVTIMISFRHAPSHNSHEHISLFGEHCKLFGEHDNFFPQFAVLTLLQRVAADLLLPISTFSCCTESRAAVIGQEESSMPITVILWESALQSNSQTAQSVIQSLYEGVCAAAHHTIAHISARSAIVCVLPVALLLAYPEVELLQAQHERS